MSLHRSISTCAFPALSTVLAALAATTLAAAQDARAPAVSTEDGVPAFFSWADFDGDTRIDIASVGSDGKLQLLANAGGGRFEDATERAGLAGVANAALAVWADYDADGRLDLFVGAREGASWLFHNEGDLFVDMAAGSGLVVEGAVRSAHWLDEDGDGRLDLHVGTTATNRLFRGLEGGFFEVVDLPPPGQGSASGASGSHVDAAGAPGKDASGLGIPAVATTREEDRETRDSAPRIDQVGIDDLQVAGDRLSLDPIPGAATPLGHFPLACASSLADKSNPGACVEASTVPALGRLHPLSTNLFVAVGGQVGIGTTSPAAKLHVAGNARIAGTLTLAPAGDQALDVSTGSIYKDNTLFLHTRGGLGSTGLGREALSLNTGPKNTALGNMAMRNNTTGYRSTALGSQALYANTTGSLNVACGYMALSSNQNGKLNTVVGSNALSASVDGHFNTAIGGGAMEENLGGPYAGGNTACGYGALRFGTTGSGNTAVGMGALEKNDGRWNTAIGASALSSNTTGFKNTASGVGALLFNTTGYGNTASGYYALRDQTVGRWNTASGFYAMHYNQSGSYNVACGFLALGQNNTGSGNIAVGDGAGFFIEGSNNIAIGNQGSASDSGTIRIGRSDQHGLTYIAGIRGVTTGSADAIPVLVDGNGQLGTISSSARFKEEIRDMGGLSERLLELRPVVFRYKPEVQAGERPLEYGLIAEEVAEVFPELVVYDDEGRPFTVKYHLLASMLLNELEKLHRRLEERDAARGQEIDELRDELSSLRTLQARLAALEAGAGARPPEAQPASATAER